jgi:hypothetical protein
MRRCGKRSSTRCQMKKSSSVRKFHGGRLLHNIKAISIAFIQEEVVMPAPGT